MNNHIWWAWAIKNSVVLICWTVLAIVFGKWWIALFAILCISWIGTAKTKTHMICDGCGRYSPYAEDHKTAIEEELKAGWFRRRNGDKWEDFCPECQAKEDA